MKSTTTTNLVTINRDNASPAELREQLEAERDRRELAKLRAETAFHEADARIRESQAAHADHIALAESIWNNWQPEVVDNAARWLERSQFYGFDSNSSRPTDSEDTRDGNNAPYWRSLNEYRQIQGMLRDIANVNEIGKTLIEKICDYVVHVGFTHAIEPREAKDFSDATAALCRDAKSILDEFHDRSFWRCAIEADIVGDMVATGEKLVWIRNRGGGQAEAVVVPLEQIAEPMPSYHEALEDQYDLPPCSWSYGIATLIDDTSKVVGFFWDRDHTGVNYDFIPIDEAIWVKVNTKAQVKRGIGDFWPVLESLLLSSPLKRNLTFQAAIQASIAYIRKVTSGSPSGSVSLMGSTSALSRRNPVYGRIDGEIHRPGGIHEVTGCEYESGPVGNSQAESYIAVYELVLRVMHQRWNFPEYMATGDGGTANKSTTEDSTEPFYRRIERVQGFIAQHFRKADLRVLEIAIRAGRLAKHGVESVADLMQRAALVVTGSPVTRSDPSKLIDTDIALVDGQIMSRQTAAERQNLNWERERQRIETEAAERIERQRSQLELQSQFAKPNDAGQGQPPAPADPPKPPAGSNPTIESKPKRRKRRRVRNHADDPASIAEADQRCTAAAAILWGDYPGGSPHAE